MNKSKFRFFNAVLIALVFLVSAVSYAQTADVHSVLHRDLFTSLDMAVAEEASGVSDLSSVESVADDLIAQWDIGIAASFASGTPTAINNIITPANGDTKSDYNLSNNIGSGLSFVGTEGVGGSYLEMPDENTKIVQTISSASVSQFQKDFSRSDQGNDWTLVMVIEIASLENNRVYWSNFSTSSPLQGWYLRTYDAAGGILRQFSVNNGSAFSNDMSVGTAYPDPILIAVRYTKSTRAYDFAVNADTFSTGRTMQANTAWSDGRLTFMGTDVLNNYTSEPNSRWYGAALFNQALDNDQLADVRDWYQSHTGLTL